ncbi:sterol desaturase family protein [Rosettibacter firmus]|uniref:sterol desaturase family protein n=1 Tax=Rosettibacter firmus TaxID=3111522 RepID=UPI00336BBD41
MAKNFVTNEDVTVRLFENNFLEMFTRVHWSVPLWIYLPVIFYLIYNAFLVYHISVLKFIFLFISGIIIWTITEYTLHRFVFHYEPKSKTGKRIHFLVHGVHHAYPKDSKRLVMPPAVSIPLAILFFILYKSIFGEVNILPFYSGFLVGYLIYDMTHYAVHHFNIHNKFWLAIKKHHMKHHYQDSLKGFGVSQPLWDYVFDTDFKYEKITK